MSKPTSGQQHTKGSQRDQTPRNLTASAEGGVHLGPTISALPAAPTRSKAQAVSSIAALHGTPASYTCKVQLKIAVFFDGTGNNLDADIDSKEHSNVARLFRSHARDDSKSGTYRIYVPGLGTYFKEIGDPADEDGLAFGKRGEPRLQWVMRRVDELVASHPQANITGLRIALFGFSRGAALARAFALRVQKRCKQNGDKRLWDKGGFSTDLYFMGLFDTVASVGLPASTSMRSVRIAKRWDSLDQGLTFRRRDPDNGLEPWSNDGSVRFGIAFGKLPGADPTPGVIDGHMDWASDLRIAPMVQRCVHVIATHEQRNSFPLDSAREGRALPACVGEYWCPGVHSDVGGGYRPGEGGKSLDSKQLLSLIPLNSMHKAALSAGVPLGATNDPRSGDDFEVSPVLLTRYDAYVKLAEQHCTAKYLEGRMLGNAKLLFAWRFKRIRERGAGPRSDAATIATQEKSYARERLKLDQEIANAQRDPVRLAAEKQVTTAEADLATARARYTGMMRRDWVNTEQLAATTTRLNTSQANLDRARQQFAQADDAHMKLKARQATLPGDGLLDRLAVYDKHLMLDAAAVLRTKKLYPNARVRPHYVNLLEAYEAEFVRNNGLLSNAPEVLAFFDNYIHDSMAGFAKDQTLPSDPRVVYLGGDTESQYALNKTSEDAVAIA